jgi:hypothetical protein
MLSGPDRTLASGRSIKPSDNLPWKLAVAQEAKEFRDSL